MSGMWITAEEAQARLGVKLQTLYAYASRGMIAVRSDTEDPRRSLYAADDVMRLSQRKARGRAGSPPPAETSADQSLGWTASAVVSGIAAVADGRLFYRGQEVTTLAETATLESVARLLWRCDEEDPFHGLAPHPALVAGPEPRVRAFALLAHRAAHDAATSGRAPVALRREAASVLTDLVDAVCGQVRNGPLHDRLAKTWRLEGLKADMVRRALVLAVDETLTPSSLAVRVAASTGAPLAASVLAGLSTYAGPLHGGMPAQVTGFVAEARRSPDPRHAAMQRLAQGLDVPGFGHPLFPEGDPRARAVASALRYADDLMEIAAAGEAVTGQAPNLDFALVAMTRTLGLPVDAPQTIMLVARAVSWLAHALEQRVAGAAITPRVRYAAEAGPGQEPTPDAANAA